MCTTSECILFSRSLSIDDSPRLDDVPKPRPRHKTDIFGKTDQVDVDLETDSPSAHRFHRAGPGGRKTPTQVNNIWVQRWDLYQLNYIFHTELMMMLY